MWAIYATTGILAEAIPPVEPGNGELTSMADQIANLAVLQPATAKGNGVPYGAADWPRPFDPSDRAPYAWDFSNIIGEGVSIADIVRITVSATGVALGVEVDNQEGRAPIITNDGKHVQVYFLVNVASQTSQQFTNDGVKVPVSVLIRTDENPFEEYERTAILSVRQL